MAGLFKQGANTVTEQEKINGFQVNQSTYGAVVPIVFGTTRISGNIIDYFAFTAIQHTETTRTGKGGGGSSSTNITYTYKAAILVGLCEGYIESVGKVWQGTDTITNLSKLGFTLFRGAMGQPEWSYTQSVSPARALPYSGLAYVGGYVDLSNSGSVYNYNFEVKGLLQSGGDGIDCNPADVCDYILSNSVNGIGLTGINAAAMGKFREFAAAADLLGSLPLTEQAKAYEIVNNLCEACDVMVFDSQGEIKFVPRCEDNLTDNGETYTPVLTTLYDLDEDDFLPFDDGRLVQFSRTPQSETYNQATVEYINRANNYESEAVDKQVLADVSTRGLRPASTKSYHFFHTKARAEQVAMRLALKSCYDRLTYTFRLSWTFCLLEPGDIVTLSLSTGPLLLNRVPVRIETVEEDVEGELEITAKPLANGRSTPAKFDVYDSERASRDFQVDPGNAAVPVMFELPSSLSGAAKTFIATSGGANWGGANIWLSDDGDTYAQKASTATKARYGVLLATLPVSTTEIDTTNTLSVNLSISGGTLTGGTQADAQNKRTLCWVDGELIAYATATLTGTNRYNLTYLVRGCYGTPIAAHAVGAAFVRVDDTLPGVPYALADIGKTVYAKLQSVNIYGAGAQDLSEIAEYSHVITGITPPNVSGILLEEDSFLLGDGTVLTDVLVAFSTPTSDMALKYLAYVEKNGDGTWTLTGNADPNGFRISALKNTVSVKVKIVTESADGVSAGAVSSTLVLTGKSAPPSDVANFTATADPADSTKIKLACDKITDLDFKAIEIRVGNTWETAVPLPLLYGFDTTYTATASGLLTFRARALDWSNNYSQNEAVAQVTAQIEPATPTGFNSVQNGREVLLFWGKNSEADVVGYEIRQGATFDSGALVASGITETNLIVPVSTETTYKYWVKAYNRAGNYSAAGASASVTVVDLPPVNVILTYDEIALQSGVHTRTVFGTSYYTCLTFPGLCSDYPITKCNEVGGASVLKLSGVNTDGVYLAARKDLGGIVTVNLKANFVSSALLGTGSLARLQIRTSKDGTIWDDWSDFVPATKTTRYIDWQVLLEQYSASYPVEVGIWTELVDVDDKDITGTYTVPVGGATISYGYAYHAQPVGVVTAIGAGLYADVTDRGLNDFSVVVRNASTNADVGGPVDYRFKGY